MQPTGRRLGPMRKPLLGMHKPQECQPFLTSYLRHEITFTGNFRDILEPTETTKTEFLEQLETKTDIWRNLVQACLRSQSTRLGQSSNKSFRPQPARGRRHGEIASLTCCYVALNWQLTCLMQLYPRLFDNNLLLYSITRYLALLLVIVALRSQEKNFYVHNTPFSCVFNNGSVYILHALRLLL
jgi:hypothetical protein